MLSLAGIALVAWRRRPRDEDAQWAVAGPAALLAMTWPLVAFTLYVAPRIV